MIQRMDPLGSESDPYWKRQEEQKDPNEEQFNNGVREITVNDRKGAGGKMKES